MNEKVKIRIAANGRVSLSEWVKDEDGWWIKSYWSAPSDGSEQPAGYMVSKMTISLPDDWCQPAA